MRERTPRRRDAEEKREEGLREEGGGAPAVILSAAKDLSCIFEHAPSSVRSRSNAKTFSGIRRRRADGRDASSKMQAHPPAWLKGDTHA